MHYISTRGRAPRLDFSEVLLDGLGRDGGLYLPETWPQIDADTLRRWRGLSYADLAKRIMRLFVGTTIAAADLDRMIDDTYRGFDHRAVAPLKQLGPDEWVMELFHGPTLAFKDFALQLLGRLFDHVLDRSDRRGVILGATSGDTGSAAIEACRDRARLDVFILHPLGRTSEVQRRQMTTVLSPNIHNIAIQGTFDDAQDMVKAAFGDEGFRDTVGLTAINSINWARIAAQVVYYFHAGLALGAPDRPIAFSVPTGNFGDVYAGYIAARMGLPVAKLIVATNENDILARFFRDGDYSSAGVRPTLSPSMDIQVASNFERLLFDLKGRDGEATAAAIATFRATGRLPVTPAEVAEAQALFDAGAADDTRTLSTIRTVFGETGEILDPHTAVGVAVGRDRKPAGVPVVVLSTAHPAKFPDAVERAIGRRPALPERMADLMERPERFETLEADVSGLKSHIMSHRRNV
ncbi:threonine synthase [Tistrella bauzanensis]|uniref:Threonine synthase n=1 Tax=Tistrella bauzanensis TaxID=657419 RepID=A0ABQ1INP2_9PROT|nr:threonine synthase [Tistrella bauzanensis]GGB46130.1 threonine synthase [Tistrella bauzanensis]